MTRDYANGEHTDSQHPVGGKPQDALLPGRSLRAVRDQQQATAGLSCATAASDAGITGLRSIRAEEPARPAACDHARPASESPR